MATIRKRGGKFQAIVRRGHHFQAKTFSKRADAEHWAKRLEIEIERNVAALPNSADGITFGELIQSYKKRGIESQKGIGRTKSYNLERMYEYFSHFPAHQVPSSAAYRTEALNISKYPPLKVTVSKLLISAILNFSEEWGV